MGNQWKLVYHIWELCGFLIQQVFIQIPQYENILVFPIMFPQYEILHYPYSVDYLGFVITSNFLKNPQPGNDTAFHRIFPFYGNLHIPKYWELHGFSLTLNMQGSEECGKSLCFPILFPYLVIPLFPYFGIFMDFCLTRKFKKPLTLKCLCFPILFSYYGITFPIFWDFYRFLLHPKYLRNP